jgi:hypothetical protein
MATELSAFWQDAILKLGLHRPPEPATTVVDLSDAVDPSDVSAELLRLRVAVSLLKAEVIELRQIVRGAASLPTVLEEVAP